MPPLLLLRRSYSAEEAGGDRVVKISRNDIRKPIEKIRDRILDRARAA
jgi:hypothetical protein